jgi:PTH1 family peptidyl-tRNA hydrolase
MPSKPSHPKTVILAIGNPGEEFKNSYHNAGLLALPPVTLALVGEKPETLDWKSYKRLFEYAGAGEFVFVKSLVFMNESGLAAVTAQKKFNVPPENFIILQDDSDLALGGYKISFDRSSGGHKGAQSIIDHLKTQAFTRVRFGIRPKTERRRKKAGDFVLAKIKPADKKILEKVFEEAATALKSKVESRKSKGRGESRSHLL